MVFQISLFVAISISVFTYTANSDTTNTNSTSGKDIKAIGKGLPQGPSKF